MVRGLSEALAGRAGRLLLWPLSLGERLGPRETFLDRLFEPARCANVIGTGCKPHGRLADLMIASIAITEGLPLFTMNPKDFVALDALLTIVPVNRPALQDEGGRT